MQGVLTLTNLGRNREYRWVDGKCYLMQALCVSLGTAPGLLRLYRGGGGGGPDRVEALAPATAVPVPQLAA